MDDNQREQMRAEMQRQAKMDVTRAQFDALQERVRRLEEQLASLTRSVYAPR